MYNPVVHYDPADFIVTPSGVKVSRKASICSPQFVEMPGGKSIVMHDVVIRGDYCNISINRYCFIDEATRLRPAHMPLSSPESLKNSSESDNTATTTDTCMNDLEERNPHATYIPMHIGKYTHIGKRCDIQAASIGLGCNIGNQCVISNRAILKDHVRVEDGTVVPADFVAPPFVILAGAPAKIVGEVSESHPTSAPFNAKNIFKKFKPKPQ